MGDALKYKATNIETKETYEGNAEEVAIFLGVSASTIYKVQIEGRKVHGKWIIEKEGQRESIDPPPKFPPHLLREWDAATAKIRRCAKQIKKEGGRTE